MLEVNPSGVSSFFLVQKLPFPKFSSKVCFWAASIQNNLSHLLTSTCLPLSAVLPQRGYPPPANSTVVPSTQTLYASTGRALPDPAWLLFSVHGDPFVRFSSAA